MAYHKECLIRHYQKKIPSDVITVYREIGYFVRRRDGTGTRRRRRGRALPTGKSEQPDFSSHSGRGFHRPWLKGGFRTPVEEELGISGVAGKDSLHPWEDGPESREGNYP